LIAGLVIGAIGVDALRHADRREDLALAAIPIVLATHQLIEAVAWWGLQGIVPPSAGEGATTLYLVLALGVIPALIPYAVMRSEPPGRRRSLMIPFVAAGVVVGVVLLFGLAANPHSAAIGGRYLAYQTVTPGGGLTAAIYALAVCIPLLLSSSRKLVTLGIVNVPVVVGLWIFLAAGLISLWCIWAAVSSLAIAHHIRQAAPAHDERSTGRFAPG